MDLFVLDKSDSAPRVPHWYEHHPAQPQAPLRRQPTRPHPPKQASNCLCR